MRTTRLVWFCKDQFRNFWTKSKNTDAGTYQIVVPGRVSPKKLVPDHIQKPNYYETGVPSPGPDKPEIKNEHDISKMRDSCRLAANILRKIGDSIRIGQTTDDIDVLAHNLIVENNAYPSPLNYKLFPKSVCTSVNNVACHGIPDDRPLENGDIVNVDITVYLNGYHGDCSKTFLVGNVDSFAKELVSATEFCLNEAISICKPMVPFWSIGACIEQRAKRLGFNVIPAFVGHGIGTYFHGPPEIYHIRNSYPGLMQPGMTFTIEPALTAGDQEIEILEDYWTAVTVDNARTAQCEHTILITTTGAEILTLPDDT